MSAEPDEGAAGVEATPERVELRYGLYATYVLRGRATSPAGPL